MWFLIIMCKMLRKDRHSLEQTWVLKQGRYFTTCVLSMMQLLLQEVPLDGGLPRSPELQRQVVVPLWWPLPAPGCARQLRTIRATKIEVPSPHLVTSNPGHCLACP